MNFLEQLVSEWYAYKGYFVRANIKYGRRKGGGYEGEMDVVAFDPNDRELIHIETSMDADSWEQRRARFQKKFRTASSYYTQVFKFEIQRVKRIAILDLATRSRNPREDWGDIAIVRIPEFISGIVAEMKETSVLRSAVPESYPLVRAIQFVACYGECKAIPVSKGTVMIDKRREA